MELACITVLNYIEECTVASNDDFFVAIMYCHSDITLLNCLFLTDYTRLETIADCRRLSICDGSSAGAKLFYSAVSTRTNTSK